MDFAQTCRKNGDPDAGHPASLSYSAGDITEITIHDTPSHYSVTAVLNYCKSKILKPYLRLLCIVGLRPLSTHENQPCIEFFSYYYTCQVIFFMIIGYILQYMSCFRRDRGFGIKHFNKSQHENSTVPDMVFDRICHGSLLFSYIIPHGLHLLGYMHALSTFRSSDDDQLPSLMERVFLALSNLSDGFMSQKKLVKMLWLFVTVSLIWMTLSFACINIMMAEAMIQFRWLENKPEYCLMLMKVFLIACTLWHDVIQATVISNYCLQAQLLTSYLQFLRAKILQHSLHPVEWMKDIGEFKKLLKYFNYQLAPAVCIFSMTNMTFAISGFLWLLNFDPVDTDTFPIYGISWLNVLLWFLIAFAPFIQAARLTSACESIRTVGHEVRTRPFVHQTTPGNKLDSILLFSSSLRFRAKLFGVPIHARCVLLLLTLISVVTFVLGQLHYLTRDSQHINLP